MVEIIGILMALPFDERFLQRYLYAASSTVRELFVPAFGEKVFVYVLRKHALEHRV
jgi:hypothetical protein